MNKANSIKKIALAASISLAAALAFSCSSDSEETNEPSSSSADISSSSYSSSSSLLYSSSSSIGDIAGDSSSSSSGDGQGGGSSSSSGGGGNYDGSRRIITEVYELKNKTDNSFAYLNLINWGDCKENGVLKARYNTINYSIDNNILTWKNQWAYDNDTLLFSGTSNDIAGIWTRTKNENTSCKLDRYDDFWYCATGWDIIKAEFAENAITLTRDYCQTDELDLNMGDMVAGSNGWKARVIDCDTYEMYKGTETVTAKYTESSLSWTYKGNTCILKNPTISEQEKACGDAWNEVQAENMLLEDRYETLLGNLEFGYSSFFKCVKNSLPADFLGEDDYDYEESAMPKMLMKKANVKAKMLKM